MPFLATISINQCFNRGQPRYGLKREAQEWKADLTLLFRNQCQFHDIKPPVQFLFKVKFPRSTRKADPSNFEKLAQDAVAEALGFDDDYSRMVSGPFLGEKTKERVGEFIFIVRELSSLQDCFILPNEIMEELI